jgi:hypothetical protein
MNINDLQINEDFRLIQQKIKGGLVHRQVLVNKKDNKYYKLWRNTDDPSRRNYFGLFNVVPFCTKVEFYDNNTAGAFEELIRDDQFCYGYITAGGKSFKSRPIKWTNDLNEFYLAVDWSDVVNNTNQSQRHFFIKSLINNSIEHNIIHCDAGPSNIILYQDKLSLIDLEACGSDLKTLGHSPDGLDWEDNVSDWGRGKGKFKFPYGNAKRDFNLFLFSYLFQCLGIKNKIYVDKISDLKEIHNQFFQEH